ncbi:VolA/Pla-1 family phospholipase [Colwellia echini]|uniref:Lipase n=1 Tax=Colwellia echini TaxID=1982103 RepID=A0ABY3MVG6_9GAMM|nr:VolA/Pla-1 family phospholipase [Colwellia echini]TYK65208.1 lipase [Colwellia echini]
MKKLALSIAIISALSLSACNNETIEDVQQEVEENNSGITSLARIVFDPGAATPRLSIPNDLLLSGTIDGTLNLPDENLVDANGDKLPVDYFNPSAAVGALDGWSTIAPFNIEVDLPEGKTLNADSVFTPNAVHVYETIMGGNSADAECAAIPRGPACKLVAELTFGVDFIAQATANGIAIVPLKPLKAKTAYVIALTDQILDSDGTAVAGSVTYGLVKQDITEKPLVTESQLLLQTLTNSFENIAVEAGLNKENIIYSFSMTTQSIQDVSQVVKSVMLSGTPGTTPVLSAITPTGANAAMLLGLDQNDLGAGTVASFAAVSKANLSAPYYLETPYYDGAAGSCNLLADDITTGCPDLFSRWEAMGDSPVTVSGALTSGALTQDSFVAQAIAQGQDPSELLADPTKLVGLTFTVDVVVDDQGTVVSVPVDQARHLTQYNPLPQVKSYKSGTTAIDVIITTPDADRINAIAAMKKGEALTDEEMMKKPDAGWPVMIFSHGITSYKETVLAIAGTLASQGIATVAIDHPYHGARGIDFNGDGVYEISATQSLSESDPDFVNANVTSYMNLASLLTARDNVRQSEVDMLALRLSLNDTEVYGQLDATKVSFLGHSLGALTGITFTALANSGVVNPATGELSTVNPYAINSASYAFPGGGISGVLIYSPAFGPVVQDGLTSSQTFIDLVEETAGKSIEEMSEAEYQGYVEAIYPAFASQFNFAAQTILDSSDPINYSSTVKALGSPVHLMEVVGNESLGGANKSDQVIVNGLAALPLVGTEPLIRELGLLSTSETVGDGTSAVSAAVRFLNGTHSSLLNPATETGIADDAAANLAVTVEMQTEVAAFAKSGGKLLLIADDEYIQPVSE